MLSLILAESALEIVPERLRGHPSVASSSRRLGQGPASTLLDVSWHHAAMARLAGARRRGRPDIAHSALLAAAGTPLYAAGRLGVYVHTIDDAVVRVGLGARLPKSYHRFAGLFGGVLSRGGGGGGGAAADGADGRPLLEARRPMGLAELLAEIRPAVTVGMTRSGRPGTFRDAAACLAAAGGGGGGNGGGAPQGKGEVPTATRARWPATRNGGGAPQGKGEGGGGPCLVVGGFQRGGFSRATMGLLDEAISVGPRRLEAHVVVSRALYEYEEASGAPARPPARAAGRQ